MLNLPQIKIGISPDIDAKAFINFLWHPFLKQNRHKIIKVYPEIESMVSSNSAKEDIKKYLFTLHQQKKEQLEIIKNDQEKIIEEKGEKAFQRLRNNELYLGKSVYLHGIFLPSPFLAIQRRPLFIFNPKSVQKRYI